MWLSIRNHICNVHQHDSTEFPVCLHEPLLPFTNDDGVLVDRDWVDKGKK